MGEYHSKIIAERGFDYDLKKERYHGESAVTCLADYDVDLSYTLSGALALSTCTHICCKFSEESFSLTFVALQPRMLLTSRRLPSSEKRSVVSRPTNKDSNSRYASP